MLCPAGPYGVALQGCQDREYVEHEVVLPQEWPGVVVDVCLVDLGHGKSKNQPNPCSDMSQLQLDMHRMRRPNALS